MAEVGTKYAFSEFASGTHLEDSSPLQIYFLGCRVVGFCFFFFMRTNQKAEEVKTRMCMVGEHEGVKASADKSNVGVPAGCASVSYPAFQLRTKESC